MKPAKRVLPSIRNLKQQWGLKKPQALEWLDWAAQGRCYINDVYQVEVRDCEPIKGWPSMVWLSIKRRDREPCHDWRDLQRIKSELVGAECEGVELYPAESRNVDMANQYHLWVIKAPGVVFPIGFNDGRCIGTPEAAAVVGAKQRAHGKDGA